MQLSGKTPVNKMLKMEEIKKNLYVIPDAYNGEYNLFAPSQLFNTSEYITSSNSVNKKDAE